MMDTRYRRETHIHIQHEHDDTRVQRLKAIHAIWIFDRELGIQGAKNAFDSGQVFVENIEDAKKLVAVLGSIIGINATLIIR